jgi:hypothetical protein
MDSAHKFFFCGDRPRLLKHCLVDLCPYQWMINVPPWRLVCHHDISLGISFRDDYSLWFFSKGSWWLVIVAWAGTGRERAPKRHHDVTDRMATWYIYKNHLDALFVWPWQQSFMERWGHACRLAHVAPFDANGTIRCAIKENQYEKGCGAHSSRLLTSLACK